MQGNCTRNTLQPNCTRNMPKLLVGATPMQGNYTRNTPKPPTFLLKKIQSVLRKSATFCMVLRVKSGNRSLTIRQALMDELNGGDFLASMSDKEFEIFQLSMLMQNP